MKHGAELVYPTSAPVNSDRVLVCGGRDYADARMVKEVLDSLRPKEIIHGAARGADRLADQWANENCVQTWAYPANWKRDGRAAGPLRNARMLLMLPTLAVAFPGGRGTEDMVRRALAASVTVLRIRNGSESRE